MTSYINERYVRYVKRSPICCAGGEMWLIRQGILGSPKVGHVYTERSISNTNYVNND